MEKRKKKLILTGVALLVTTIGTTYAWWTASSTIEQKVTLGKMAITAKMNQVAENTNFEPGLVVEQKGTVANTGSIDSLIKVNNNSQIKLNETTEYVKANEKAVQLTIKPAGGAGYWYSDLSGNHYLLLAPGETASIYMNTSLVGENMDNNYMNADVRIAGTFKATQVLEGAIQSEFGINPNELQVYEETNRAVSRNTNTTDASKALAVLKEKLSHKS